jgi:hypothetical protein
MHFKRIRAIYSKVVNIKISVIHKYILFVKNF